MSKVRHTVGALLICTIVLVVPLFSVWQIGRFFFGGPKRSAKPLAAMTIRAADNTQTQPRLFEEPLITVSFDDGHETTYSVAMPLLQKYGIRTTQYLLSGTADNPAYVSWKQMEQMQKAGHEIACHTVSHENLTLLEDADLHMELKNCKDEMTKRFGPIYNFASPYGAENERTLNAINKYFSSERNTLGDPKNGVNNLDVNIATNFNRRSIIGVTVRSDTTVEQLRQLVEYTRANNGWLVLTYHQADDESSEYSVTSDDFKKHFEYLSGTDVRIVTVQDALKGYNTPKAARQ